MADLGEVFLNRVLGDAKTDFEEFAPNVIGAPQCPGEHPRYCFVIRAGFERRQMGRGCIASPAVLQFLTQHQLGIVLAAVLQVE